MVLLALSGVAGPGICERADADGGPARVRQRRAPMTAVAVEVDIFSGRPNPSWTLSEAEASVFASRRSALQQTAPAPRSGALGYRGLVVELLDEPGRRMYIRNGVIELSDGTSSVFFADPGRSLERWLIGTSRPALGQEVLEAIDADLQRRDRP
jgi:hypothetical protein